MIVEPFFLRPVVIPSKRKRHHHKSRGGCITCKARRVKCDEGKPTCRRCQTTDRGCEGYKAPKRRAFLPGEQEEWPARRPAQYLDSPKTKNDMDVVSDDNSSEDVSRVLSSLPVPQRLEGLIAPQFEHHGEYVNDIFKYVFGNWPQLSAGQSNVEGIRGSWLQRMLNFPMLFNTTFWFNAQVHDFRIGDAASQQKIDVRTEAVAQAARLAANELQFLLEDPQRKPSDELIVLVLMLSACPDLLPNKQSSTTPMASLQRNDIIGTVKPNQHDKALQLLLDRKGGIEAVRFPGIPKCIAVRDLLTASFTSQQPKYHRLWESSIFTHRTDKSYRSSLTLAGLDMTLASVLCDMRTLVNYLMDTEGGQPVILDELVVARAEVQHKLLSLEPSACRTAALMFSDLAIFPLPPMSGVRDRIARDFVFQHAHLGGTPSLQLWITSMIAMNAPEDCIHDLLVKMRKLTTKLCIETFSELKEAMRMYLWWDVVCEDLGRALWEKVHGYDFLQSLQPSITGK